MVMNCSRKPKDFFQIPHEVPISDVWNNIYFYFIIPVAYIGSTLTVLLMIKILRYNRTIPDLLICIIALNDFGLVLFVFTTTVIAQVVDHWFGEEICYMHFVLNVFFSTNVFTIITFTSCERYWAICKPFHYHRVATVRFIMGIVAAIMAMNFALAASPLFVLPVSLQPGWYCDISFDPFAEESCETLEHENVEIYLILEVTIVFVGLLVGGICDRSVIIHLKIKLANQRNTDMKLEKRMIQVVLLLHFAFVFTWIPSVISILLCLFGEKGLMCAKAEYAASRIVNINVAINPFLYAIMKPSYRRGYWMLLKQGIQLLSFGLLNEKTMKGGDDFKQLLHTAPVMSFQLQPSIVRMTAVSGKRLKERNATGLTIPKKKEGTIGTANIGNHAKGSQASLNDSRDMKRLQIKDEENRQSCSKLSYSGRVCKDDAIATVVGNSSVHNDDTDDCINADRAIGVVEDLGDKIIDYDVGTGYNVVIAQETIPSLQNSPNVLGFHIQRATSSAEEDPSQDILEHKTLISTENLDDLSMSRNGVQERCVDTLHESHPHLLLDPIHDTYQMNRVKEGDSDLLRQVRSFVQVIVKEAAESITTIPDNDTSNAMSDRHKIEENHPNVVHVKCTLHSTLVDQRVSENQPTASAKILNINEKDQFDDESRQTVSISDTKTFSAKDVINKRHSLPSSFRIFRKMSSRTITPISDLEDKEA